eukprot:jgi/Psemu1/212457/e_gw1.601.3.1
MVDADYVANAARIVLAFPAKRKWNSKDKEGRIISVFGASSSVIAEIWNRIETNVQEGIELKHLLWALVFLKVYSTEEVHCAIVDWPNPRTFREKAWHVIEAIADLKPTVIKLESRFTNAPNGDNVPLLTLDCTDCMINEPFPWDRKWCSHKFNGPGLKYELAVAIFSNKICWTRGPFFATANESRIFKEGLGLELPDDEPVECDSGPGGDPWLMPPSAGINSYARKKKSIYRGRQETVFSRLKQFNVLATHFHHSDPDNEVMMWKHQLCFEAVVVITQLKLDVGGESLFDGGAYDVTY